MFEQVFLKELAQKKHTQTMAHHILLFIAFLWPNTKFDVLIDLPV